MKKMSVCRACGKTIMRPEVFQEFYKNHPEPTADAVELFRLETLPNITDGCCVKCKMPYCTQCQNHRNHTNPGCCLCHEELNIFELTPENPWYAANYVGPDFEVRCTQHKKAFMSEEEYEFSLKCVRAGIHAEMAVPLWFDEDR